MLRPRSTITATIATIATTATIGIAGGVTAIAFADGNNYRRLVQPLKRKIQNLSSRADEPQRIRLRGCEGLDLSFYSFGVGHYRIRWKNLRDACQRQGHDACNDDLSIHESLLGDESNRHRSCTDGGRRNASSVTLPVSSRNCPKALLE